jgi:uncharacterized RDD family membrane protein YckC
MSNDPFANQPTDPTPGADPGATPGWGQDPTPGAIVRPASVGKRVGAYIIDVIGLAIVVGVVLAVTGIGGGLLGMAASGQGYIGNVIAALVSLAYFGLMEAGSGQTLAKKMLKIRAVAADGSPLSLQAALVRRLPFVVGSLLPTQLGSLIGFVLVLAILITAIQDEPEHRGIHDKWAGSKVVDV